MADDNGGSERELHRLLQYLLDRDLTQSEITEALGISRSAYYDQKAEGRLANPENLINAAHHYGLNPVELLLRYEHISIQEVLSVAEFLAANPISVIREGVTLMRVGAKTAGGSERRTVPPL